MSNTTQKRIPLSGSMAKPLVICSRWRDPTWLVFGRSRSFSPCVVRRGSFLENQPFLQFETSQIPQVAQTTKRVLYLLRRVECFVWKAVKQASDLIIGTMLLCKSNEIS